jgi:hypothetical protein
MTITTIAIVNGVLAVLMLVALAAVMSIGLRLKRTPHESSAAQADELARAA